MLEKSFSIYIKLLLIHLDIKNLTLCTNMFLFRLGIFFFTNSLFIFYFFGGGVIKVFVSNTYFLFLLTV